MKRPIWKKIGISIMMVGIMFMVATTMEVCATNETEIVVSDISVEKTMNSGYVDYTNNAVSWTYDAATKTITITGSGVRSEEVINQFNKLTNTSDMPAETEYIVFENCNLSGDLSFLFSRLVNLKDIDFSGVSFENVASTRQMFAMCEKLTNLDLRRLDTSMVVTMRGMFEGCNQLISVNTSGFDTSKVEDMDFMFYNCNSLKNVDVSKFDTSKVKTMVCMFNNCSSLTSLDVSGFDTSQVQYMGYMFNNCNNLESLDVSDFNTSAVT